MIEATEREWLFWPLVHALGRRARETQDLPESLVDAAKRAVAFRFTDLAGTPLDAAARQRVAAYFWGTIRRRALRHAPDYAQRVVRATLAADLEDAGWDSSAIRRELERVGLSA